MILPKYYCEKCKKLKTRKEVNHKAQSVYWGIPFKSTGLHCKWCHEPVISSQYAIEQVLKDYFEWQEEKRKQYEMKLNMTPHKK